MKYRRDRITGGTYFFTVVTDGRRPVFHDPAAVGLLRGAFRRVYADRPFVIDAMVVLPDHLHTVRTLPKDDSDYSMRWRLIKRTFTSAVRFQKPIWQKRFWEHRIRDDDDWRRHLDYIHWNPGDVPAHVANGRALLINDYAASPVQARAPSLVAGAEGAA
jgi:putative transposase